MSSLHATPADEDLQHYLLGFLSSLGERRPMQLVNRRFNPYSSRSHSEIASCRFADGRHLEIMIKYEADYDRFNRHRGGTCREALVYERILRPLGIGPMYFGSKVEPAEARSWIALEYISGGVRASKGPQPESLCAAALWLAQFHSRGTRLIQSSDLDFLPSYDTTYYMSWVSKAMHLGATLRKRHPWFDDVCVRALEVFEVLTSAPQTIVHGEFYPKNVLWRDGSIFPVDWESAAIAPAEVDLASLIEGWPQDIRAKVLTEYAASRGTSADDPELARRLTAARLYWAYRWMVHYMKIGHADNGNVNIEEFRNAVLGCDLLDGV